MIQGATFPLGSFVPGTIPPLPIPDGCLMKTERGDAPEQCPLMDKTATAIIRLADPAAADLCVRGRRALSLPY